MSEESQALLTMSTEPTPPQSAPSARALAAARLIIEYMLSRGSNNSRHDAEI